MTRPHLDDDERRRRLGVRHALAGDHRLGSTLEVAERMAALHATEPGTVHLAVHARCDAATVDDVEHALYRDRSLVKVQAMRQTLFAVPRALLGATVASAGARTADQARTRVLGMVRELSDTPEQWLARVSEQAIEALGEADGPLSTAELVAAVPDLATKVVLSPGTKWSQEVTVGSKLVGLLHAQGVTVRADNRGGWWQSRPTWTLADTWLTADRDTRAAVDRPTADEGWQTLVRHWLQTFGPGTRNDIAWWLGSTLRVVDAALTSLEAVEVDLDDGSVGFVLPDDLDPTDDPGPWAALLPVLDSTTMGWKARGFHLGAHRSDLFDSVGNGGTTAWWNGRVVGGWVQDAHGVVHLVPLESLTKAAERALTIEADRLTAWVEGRVVHAHYAGPALNAAAKSLR